MKNALLIAALFCSVGFSANRAVPDTKGTAFQGSCSIRMTTGEWKLIGNFDLRLNDAGTNCPGVSFSLEEFFPGTTDNSIYVEYQGDIASPKFLTFQGIAYHNISLSNAQVGNVLSAELPLKNGQEAACDGEIVRIK
jgi:hypothetical protein